MSVDEQDMECSISEARNLEKKEAAFKRRAISYRRGTTFIATTWEWNRETGIRALLTSSLRRNENQRYALVSKQSTGAAVICWALGGWLNYRDSFSSGV